MAHGSLVSGESSNMADRDHLLEPKHKVFLSHSGAQKPFVEELCLDLEKYYRYPFFDKRRDSLPIGERFPPPIFEAIKQCEVGVVVLSKEFFTRTKWPMLELVAMVKSRKENPNMKIIPVFFGISCAECRDIENLSQWQLEKCFDWLKWFKWAWFKWDWFKWAWHDNRIDLDEWVEALKIFGSTNGLDIIGLGEVKLREEIVDAVCKLVPSEKRWDDLHVQGRLRLCKTIREKINQTQVSQMYGVRVVGLYGMGGIGKTTICKAMCNNLFTKFRGKVFHAELDKNSKVELMKEVLRTLTDTRHELVKGLNFGECCHQLRKTIGKQGVFLILDNLLDTEDSIEEARTYLRARFAPGSIVIVAARSLSQLEGLNIDKNDFLEMPELEVDEAKSLFLDQATSVPEVRTAVDEHLIMLCVERCYFLKGDGRTYHYHPLALKVLGLQLGYTDRYNPEEWRKKLDALDTFNQLRRPHHPIFSILRISFDSLLPEDQLLFMDIALFFPPRQERDKLNIFEWLSMVHGIRAGDVPVKTRLEGLKRKSLLESVGDDGTTDIRMHDLWREFSVMETKAGDFNRRTWVYEAKEPGALVEASPSGGFWEHLKRIHLEKGVTSLQSVNLYHCLNVIAMKLWDLGVPSEEVLDLRPLKHLKSLSLEGTFSGPVVGLGSLSKLGYLIWFNMPPNLPCVEEIGSLTNLEVLQIVNSRGDKLPDLSRLTSLRVACFYSSHCVQTITGLGSKMNHLRYLDLSDCSWLCSCPGVGDLVALEEFDLSYCKRLEELPNLQKLINLRLLNIEACFTIPALPGFGDLVALQELRADWCFKLAGLPNVSKLTKLQVLALRGCPLEAVPGLSDLMALQELRAGSKRPADWFDLSKLSDLQTLQFSGWGSQMNHLPDLLSLTSLQTLRIEDCEFTDVSGFCNLISLQTLGIRGCGKLKSLPDMHKLTNLRTLAIELCDGLEDWQGVRNLSSLEELEIWESSSQKNILDICMLTCLQSLTLRGCGYTDLLCIKSLTQLKSLKCESIVEVKEVADLSNFPRLKCLRLKHCERLINLTCSEPLTALEVLKVYESRSLEAVPDLSTFSRLKKLNLGYCGDKLVSLRSSAPLAALKKLDLLGCSSLRALPDLSTSKDLCHLDLRETGIKLSADDVQQLKASCPMLTYSGTSEGEEWLFFDDRS